MTPAAYLHDGIRTPFGRYGGALAHGRPDDLAAHVVTALLARQPDLDPVGVDEVIFGDANQAGEDNRNVARMAALLAGLPTSVPGTTVNRLCGYSLDAAMQASRMVEASDARCVIVGGVESMSRAPGTLLKAERAFAGGDQTLHSSTLGWRMVNRNMPSQWTISLGASSAPLARGDHRRRLPAAPERQLGDPRPGTERDDRAVHQRRCLTQVACSADHAGATSQDIIDTAMMLVAKRALVPLLADADAAASAVGLLARQHRDTPMLGLTPLQPALPTLFGLKVSQWMVAIDQACDARRDATLAVQMGGPVGHRDPAVAAGWRRRSRSRSRCCCGTPIASAHAGWPRPHAT